MTNYIWFNSNPFYAIMETALEDDSIGLSKMTNLSAGDGLQDSGVKLYPNPTTGIVNISFEHFSVSSNLMVTDFSGKQLFQKSILDMDSEIDLSPLPTGIYFIRISDSERTIVRKIAKL